MPNREALFQPLNVGGVKLKNRIVMAAMDTDYSAKDGSFTRRHLAYFKTRARGGVGMIVTEATSVSWPEGKISARMLNMKDDTITTDLFEMTHAVHAYGTKIIAQLHHGGFLAVPALSNNMENISASDFMGARAMTIEEVHRVEQDFIHAAVVAKNSGFDGVEVHAAHMYLLNQFLNPVCNQRTDEYGGNHENRFRMLGNIIKGIREACPKPFIISVRLGVYDFQEGGNTLEDGKIYAKMCEAAGADMLNISAGFYTVAELSPTQWNDEGPFIYMADAIKPEVSIPISIVGKLKTPAFCESVIKEGHSDLITMGRPLICDPAWPNKVLFGKENEIRTCLHCSDGCTDRQLEGSTVQCTLNPYVSYEDIYDEFNVERAGRPCKIVVVGGGVAGMQFSIIASKRGHDVTLLEKTDRLGGQMILAGKVPLKSDLRKALKWFIEETERQGVDIRMNTEATPELIKSLDPDKVVLAMGAASAFPPVEGTEYAIDGWEYIDDKVQIPEASNVAVIGGGVVGCELAHRLLDEGHKVTIIEMRPELCIGHEVVHRILLTTYLEQNENTTIEISATVNKIGNGVVYYTDNKGNKKSLKADAIICATGQKSISDELYKALLDDGMETYKISDWVNPSNIRLATRSALEMAYRI